MSTWLEIISDAYAEINAKALGNDLSGEKVEEGRRLLNRMIGQRRAQRQFTIYLQNLSFSLTAATQYTIGASGSGADFELPGIGDTRPSRIERANIRYGAAAPFTYIPIPVIGVEAWADDPWREYASGPFLPFTGIYYKPTLPLGTLYPPPYYCATGYSIELFIWNQLTAVAETDLTVEAVLPDADEEELILSLSEKLVKLYPGRSNEEEIIRQAGLARAIATRPNRRPPPLATDWP